MLANETTVRSSYSFIFLPYFLTTLFLKKQVLQNYVPSYVLQVTSAFAYLLHICHFFLSLWLNLSIFTFGLKHSAVERSFLLRSFSLWKIFGNVQDTSRLTSITNSFAYRREEAYGNVCLGLEYADFGLIDPFQISRAICQIIHQLLL